MKSILDAQNQRRPKRCRDLTLNRMGPSWKFSLLTSVGCVLLIKLVREPCHLLLARVRYNGQDLRGAGTHGLERGF